MCSLPLWKVTVFLKVRSFWLGSAQDLANCTKVEQSLLCVQAETSAKYKLLAVKQRCFALQIIVVGKGAVKEIVTSFFSWRSCSMSKLFIDPRGLEVKNHLRIFLSLALFCSCSWATHRFTQNHRFCLFGTSAKFFRYPQFPESVIQFVGSYSHN